MSRLIVFKSGQGAAGPAGASGSGSATFKDIAVSAPTTIAETPVDGQLLIVRITQDGTGHAVTWSSDFTLPPDIDTAADEVSTCIFGGFGGKWWLIALPVRGMKP